MRTLQKCLQPSEDFQKNFFLAFNGILLFVNPRCGYKPEDPRFYKCTSGSYFKRSFSLLTADGKGKSQIPSGSPGELQTRIRAQPPCQLSPPTFVLKEEAGPVHLPTSLFLRTDGSWDSSSNFSLENSEPNEPCHNHIRFSSFFFFCFSLSQIEAEWMGSWQPHRFYCVLIII